MRSVLRIKKHIPIPYVAKFIHPEKRPFKGIDVANCTNAIVTIPSARDTFTLNGKITRKSGQSITVTGIVSKREVTLNVPVNSPVVHVKLLRDIGKLI